MKKNLILFLFFIFTCNAFSQKLYLSVIGKNESETKKIDSLNYVKSFQNAKLLKEEINAVSYKLSLLGFLENEVLTTLKTNDSTFLSTINLGKKTTTLYLYIDKSQNINLIDGFNQKEDYIKLPISDVENYLNSLLKKMEQSGYSLTKIKLINFRKKEDSICADIEIIENKKRFLNDIVIKGYSKFPESHSKNIKRLFQNKVFNEKILEKINKEFEKIRFVKQIKYPEILFLTDTTKVYVYLEKSKPNKFDGFVGFSNDKNNQLIFRGYLELELQNFLNSGEKLDLFWKSDGNKQTSFNFGLELPYLFKSPIGLKTQLQIFKQDSTFQNTKTNIDLGYFFNYNKKLYLGYQSMESNDIQNQNSFVINDFKNSFITSEYQYVYTNSDDVLFPEKTKFDIKIGFGERKSSREKNEQYFTSFQLSHNLYLNNRNSINLKTQNYYLQSNSYVINELYRFGGINSIRGFNENSLQANLLTSILTEYRYLLNQTTYIHSILDYGYFKDFTSNLSDRLFGIGFGIGLLTKTGLFNLVYANGNTSNSTIKLSNSIIHINFKANF